MKALSAWGFSRMSFGCRVSGENDAFESNYTMEASAFIVNPHTASLATMNKS
jgi:hypothetical protein